MSRTLPTATSFAATLDEAFEAYPFGWYSSAPWRSPRCTKIRSYWLPLDVIDRIICDVARDHNVRAFHARLSGDEAVVYIDIFSVPLRVPTDVLYDDSDDGASDEEIVEADGEDDEDSDEEFFDGDGDGDDDDEIIIDLDENLDEIQ